MKEVIHVISLFKELGGVQQAFTSYYKFANGKSKFDQYVFSNHNISKKYGNLKNFYKINNNIFLFLKYLISKNSIVYFHNKLSSKKIFYLLKYLPISNIIFHEHGGAWNVKSNDHVKIFKSNAQYAKKIIVNSNATRNVLIKKFKIEEKKIELAYYGFKDPKIKIKNTKKNIIRVGFIGRFESFKGIHSFIKAANLLKNQNIYFSIAGDGYLKDELKLLAKENMKIKFVGNIIQPLNFIKNLDILVVPSIREPLGIVNIEAGLCKVPVIASNIDGIPEVIKHNYSGLLINPTKNISIKNHKGQAPLPDLVVNPNNLRMIRPKQLDHVILSKKIAYLSKKKKLRIKYGKNLYQNVKKKFSIRGYFEKIEEIYRQM